MKTKFFVLISMIVFAFSSCDLTSESNITPSFDFIRKPFVFHGDALTMQYTNEGMRLDTIQVGDTVFFPVYINGYFNLLNNFSITVSDTSASKLIFPPKSALDTIFSSSASDFDKGSFVFSTKSNSLYFPFKYVAKKPSSNVYILFTANSNAKAEYSHASSTLKTPIISRKSTTTLQ